MANFHFKMAAAAKFHINSAGEPGACRATQGKCPFGGEDNHYTSKQDAQEAFEWQHRDDGMKTITKSKEKFADPIFHITGGGQVSVCKSAGGTNNAKCPHNGVNRYTSEQDARNAFEGRETVFHVDYEGYTSLCSQPPGKCTHTDKPYSSEREAGNAFALTVQEETMPDKALHAPGQCSDADYGSDCNGIGHWRRDPFNDYAYEDHTLSYICDGAAKGSQADADHDPGVRVN